MRLLTLMTMSVLSIATLSPALAQDAMAKDSMKSGSMMKMSAADTKKMKACQGMSHDMMMKDAACTKMMADHPDMMKKDKMAKGM